MRTTRTPFGLLAALAGALGVIIVAHSGASSGRATGASKPETIPLREAAVARSAATRPLAEILRPAERPDIVQPGTPSAEERPIRYLRRGR